MITLQVSDQMLLNARRLSEQMGTLKRSITKGQGNLAGFIGEELVLHYLGANRENTYDFDLTHNNSTFDVKTKRTTVEPKDYYDCSVAKYNTTQLAENYIFTRVLNDMSKGWILGYMPHDEYYEKARYMKKGEWDTDNGFRVKADCYNLAIKELYDIRDLSASDIGQ